MKIKPYILVACIIIWSGLIQASNDTLKAVVSYELFEANFAFSKLITDDGLYDFPAFLFELRMAKQTVGERIWQKEFGYPEVGWSLVYGNLGPNEIFGKTFGIIPDLTLNALSDKSFGLEFRLGVGLAYFTKPYNAISNPENIYIGSRLANISLFSIKLRQKLSDHFFLQYGFNFYHFSNGHYQVPNYGMNLPGFKMGIKYYPRGYSHTRLENHNRNDKFGWRLYANIGAGVHEFAGSIGPVGGPKYMINTVEIGGYKHYNSKLNIKTGVSVKYNNDYYKIANDSGFYTQLARLKATVVTLYFGNEFLLYKLGAYFQMGLDIYAPFEKKYLRCNCQELNFSRFMKEFISTKLGFNYYFVDLDKSSCTYPFIGIFLKTNLNNADFVGINVGLLF